MQTDPGFDPKHRRLNARHCVLARRRAPARGWADVALWRAAKRAALAAGAAVTGLVATGCATDPLTAIGIPPLQRKDTASAPAEPRSLGSMTPAEANAAVRANLANRAPQDPVCKREAFAAPIDVDTAYARVMSRLRFRTLAERQFQQETRGVWIDENFRHVAQPGAYYRMTDYGQISEPGAARETEWLNMELARDGAARTNVVASFCLEPRDKRAADAAYHARLFRVMREAVLK